MIKDAAEKQNVIDEWHGVRKAHAKIKTHLLAAFAGGRGLAVSGDFPDLCHCLLLPFGFSVLESALKQLKREGVFSCGRWNVGPMMEASKLALPWSDYDLVDEARRHRNEFAHQQTICPRKRTWEYLDALEAELIAWGILTEPVQYDHTISVSRMS